MILLRILLVVLLFQNLSLYVYALDTPEDIFILEKVGKPIKLEARIDVPLELSLKKALDIALKNNLEILGAQSEKDLNKWKLWENIGNWLPDYSLGLSGNRFDGTFLVGGVFPVMTLTSNVNAFMRFDYRFFEGGKGFFNTLAAKKLYESSKENLTSFLNLITLQVTKSYNQLLREQAQLDVLAKAVTEAASELDLNKNLEKQGVGTKFDILQSDAQLAEQEQLFIAQQAKFREASIELARILNLEQGTHIKPDLNDLQVKELVDINKPINEVLSIALENRPDIKKVELEHKAQRNYIGAAFSGFLPKANFFGQYGGTGRVFFHRTKFAEVVPDAIRLDDDGNPIISMVNRAQVLDSAVNVSNVVRGGGKPSLVAIDDSIMSNKFLGISLDWTIGDGLGVPTFAKIKQARSQAEITKVSYLKLKQDIEKEIRASFLQVQSAKKLLDVAKRRVDAATEALHLAKVRLENGVGINTELLTAQKQYASALSSKVDAIIGYNNAQVEFLYSAALITPEIVASSNISDVGN